MSLNREWKQICSELSTSLIDVKAILSDDYPQIPIDVLSQKTIPLNGVVYTRQAIIRRDKMKKTKGSDITVSMFHNLMNDMVVSDELLKLFARLLVNLRKDDKSER